ncbi:hypothetical protein EGR_09885 [Echinococcus granulosus]|uniref:Uncharacterized protein n=1 Tax=Echinococcus granulosus TaxID=6210 RepID=W6U9T2_ECHGR|nr:hypothetical protein EGR_09885 [Echinococcus granulosus]EUB55252.1 hypothetical protein EGR_09885 [Echinococcus granulosus]
MSCKIFGPSSALVVTNMFGLQISMEVVFVEKHIGETVVIGVSVALQHHTHSMTEDRSSRVNVAYLQGVQMDKKPFATTKTGGTFVACKSHLDA